MIQLMHLNQINFECNRFLFFFADILWNSTIENIFVCRSAGHKLPYGHVLLNAKIDSR